MLQWVVALLPVALLAVLLGFAGGPAQIAEVAFLILAVLCVAFLVHEATSPRDER